MKKIILTICFVLMSFSVVAGPLHTLASLKSSLKDSTKRYYNKAVLDQYTIIEILYNKEVDSAAWTGTIRPEILSKIGDATDVIVQINGLANTDILTNFDNSQSDASLKTYLDSYITLDSDEKKIVLIGALRGL